MAYKLTVHFNDGHTKTVECSDDEDATLRRDDLLKSGYQEKSENIHTFYPAFSITKIVITKE